MAIFYTVLQYVPDPVADERLNFGVLVFGDGKVRARFTHSWARVQRFGDGDAAFLREFARDVERHAQGVRTLHQIVKPIDLSDDAIQRMAREWGDSIHLTPPRASLEQPDALLKRMATRVLRDSTAKNREHDRRHAAGIAASALSTACRDVLGEDRGDLVHRRATVAGKLTEHVFDVTVQNGAAYVAVRGLAFTGDDKTYLQREVDAAAWSIDDVRKKGGTSLAILALPPTRRSKQFEDATRTFVSLGADVVLSQHANEWALKTVKKVARKIEQPHERKAAR